MSELRELRQLREENGRLQRLVADLSMDRQILQEIVSKKDLHCPEPLVSFVTENGSGPFLRGWILRAGGKGGQTNVGHDFLRVSHSTPCLTLFASCKGTASGAGYGL